MKSNKSDEQLRISLQNIAQDEGDWLDAPSDEKVILKTAIFLLGHISQKKIIIFFLEGKDKLNELSLPS